MKLYMNALDDIRVLVGSPGERRSSEGEKDER
jgi:hypothetical protein